MDFSDILPALKDAIAAREPDNGSTYRIGMHHNELVCTNRHILPADFDLMLTISNDNLKRGLTAPRWHSLFHAVLTSPQRTPQCLPP